MHATRGQSRAGFQRGCSAVLIQISPVGRSGLGHEARSRLRLGGWDCRMIEGSA